MRNAITTMIMPITSQENADSPRKAAPVAWLDAPDAAGIALEAAAEPSPASVTAVSAGRVALKAAVNCAAAERDVRLLMAVVTIRAALPTQVLPPRIPA